MDTMHAAGFLLLFNSGSARTKMGHYCAWGFQPHFQIGVKVAAASLFKVVDPRLQPRAFTVGLLEKAFHKTDLPKAIIEPEKRRPYEPIHFEHCVDLAEQLERAKKEGVLRTFPSDWAAQDFKKNQKRLMVRDAILQTLDSERYGEYTSFCSRLVPVSNYLFGVVLQLKTRVLSQHPHLTKTKVDEFRVDTSLAQVCADRFLQDCANVLSLPEAGRGFDEFLRVEEILRRAAEGFMYNAAYAGRNFNGLHGCYKVCNSLSTMGYEGESNLGTLVFAVPEHPFIDVKIRFADPVELRDLRATRKLLELAEWPTCLFCDSELVYGIGQIDSRYDATREDLFVVRFVGHGKWELTHNHLPLMRVEFGEPSVPRDQDFQEKFLEIFRRVFRQSEMENTNIVRRIIENLSVNTHGTIVVISAAAESEAARFGSQCLRIDPQPLNEELLSAASRIDGAILLDTHCQCHAIGVILDGTAHPDGTRSRGARYNSAVRYVNSHEGQCTAIVLSDDGMIDFLPVLRPKISRLELEQQIDLLRAKCGAEKISVDDVVEPIEWLRMHRFYLNPEQCDEVNRMYQHASENWDSKGFWPVLDEFVPDARMDDSYFVETVETTA